MRVLRTNLNEVVRNTQSWFDIEVEDHIEINKSRDNNATKEYTKFKYQLKDFKFVYKACHDAL